MNGRTALFGLAIFMMLVVGFVVIEESEDSDAATYNYYLDAKEVFDNDYRGFYLRNSTYISIADYTDVENGISVKYSSNIKTFTITTSNTSVTTTITKKNLATGDTIDWNDYSWEYNSYGYTFNFSILYYANGGSNAPPNQDFTNYPTNINDVTLRSSEPTPPSGATFLGWALSQTATSPDYVAGESFTYIGEGLMRLYAVYQTQTIYTFTLSYNANGGSNAPASQTWSGTSTSHTFTVTSSSPTPPAGSTFYGWNNYPEYDVAAYVGGDQITLTTSGGSTSVTRTLYAIYDTPVYTITVNMADPNTGSVSPTTISNVPKYTFLNYGNYELYVGNVTATVTANPGYTWGYWTSNVGGQNLPVSVESDIIFTAHLVDRLYQVTFDNQYSPYGSVTPSSINNIPYNSPITVDGNKITINGTTVTAAPDVGYSFDHWSCIVPGTGTIPSNVTDTMRITAYFTENRTFSLVYDMKGGSPQIPTDTYIMPPNTASCSFEVSYTEPTKTGYYFQGWSYNSAATTVDVRGGDTVTVTWAGDGGSKTIYAVWQIRSDHIFNLIYDMKGGSPQLETQTYIGNYNTWTHVFFIPNTSPTKTGYDFVGWGIEDESTEPTFYPGSYVTVAFIDGSGDMTLYAIWEEVEPMSSAVFWSNSNYNGSVSILYKFGTSDNKGHTMSMDLLTGTVNEDQTTTWTDSGYELTIDISYPSLFVTATLTDGVDTYSQMVSAGNWNTFIVNIDSDKGKVSITPVRTFESFTDFTIYDKQTRTVLDFSDEISGAAIYTIAHTETDEGTNSPTFSVVNTTVFLNTFGIVLYNPMINLHDYFPQYEAIRVNFYSFALYGESITINGVTYVLDGSKITVQYVSDGDEHYLPGVMPNATVQTRAFELSNIYVTYQDGHCYLTFVNDRFTLDLGAFTPDNETISMQGLWYFATMVYEPYAAVEKHLSDWKILPETDKSQMVLLFLAILILAGAAVAIHARKSGLGIVDLVIIGAALVFGLVLLG